MVLIAPIILARLCHASRQHTQCHNTWTELLKPSLCYSAVAAVPRQCSSCKALVASFVSFATLPFTTVSRHSVSTSSTVSTTIIKGNSNSSCSSGGSKAVATNRPTKTTIFANRECYDQHTLSQNLLYFTPHNKTQSTLQSNNYQSTTSQPNALVHAAINMPPNYAQAPFRSSTATNPHHFYEATSAPLSRHSAMQPAKAYNHMSSIAFARVHIAPPSSKAPQPHHMPGCC